MKLAVSGRKLLERNRRTVPA